MAAGDRRELDERIAAGQSAILACSALKRHYRDMLLADRPTTRIAFLRIDQDVAARRLARRHGHFFDPDLLASQFADLELPGPDESAVLVVPVQDQPQATADEIVRRLNLDGTARDERPASQRRGQAPAAAHPPGGRAMFEQAAGLALVAGFYPPAC